MNEDQKTQIFSKMISKYENKEGDHIMILNIYQEWEQSGEMLEWCKENYINYETLKNSKIIREKMIESLRSIGLTELKEIEGENNEKDKIIGKEEKYRNITKSFCCGFYENSARIINGTSRYKSIYGYQELIIQELSCLKSKTKQPEYCIFFESSEGLMKDVIFQ